MNIEKCFKYMVIGMFGVSFYLLLFRSPAQVEVRSPLPAPVAESDASTAGPIMQTEPSYPPYSSGYMVPSYGHSSWSSLGTGLFMGELWGRRQPDCAPYPYHHTPTPQYAPAPGAGGPQRAHAMNQAPVDSPYKTPLRQSVRSQRSFQPKNQYAAPRRGGFGRRR